MGSLLIFKWDLIFLFFNSYFDILLGFFTLTFFTFMTQKSFDYLDAREDLPSVSVQDLGLTVPRHNQDLISGSGVL